MQGNKILFIIGTRPEAIKLAPLIIRFREQSVFTVKVCSSGQHVEMVQNVFDAFNICIDKNLGVMKPGQTLSQLTANIVTRLDEYLAKEKPQLLVIQGDTATVFCAALVAFYHKIQIAHVEAGLRTGDLYSPWPEEGNRVLASRLARFHFAPTSSSKENLLQENIPEAHIAVTGNTVIDALFIALKRIDTHPEKLEWSTKELFPASSDDKRIVLITGHRRENFGTRFQNICQAIKQLAMDFPDVHFIYPVHLNPNVQRPVHDLLSSIANVHLIKPLDYLSFVNLMNKSYLILTDSGGIQEEAPSLGKPVLVMRDTTERPEAVEAGTVILVGTDQDNIKFHASKLLNSEAYYQSMQRKHNPYGDGKASERILKVIKEYFEA